MNGAIPLLPEWSVVVAFVVGAVTGSFLNMVIYRLPRAISFFKPSYSMCPRCKHRLLWDDLIPIWSWLMARGRCRYCQAPIAARYMWVEILTGLLFAAIWWPNFVQGERYTFGFFSMLVAAMLVAVIFIDAELFIIPDELNAALLVAGLAYHAVAGSFTTALWGALTGWGLIWGFALLGRGLLGKDAMGHGDIKLMRGVGAFLGPALTAAATGIGVLLGLVVGVLALAVASRRSKGAGAEGLPEEMAYAPESFGSLLKLGVWYLLALDVVGVVFPGVYRLIGEDPPPRGLEEDDNWQPSLTTIPFGPYLAAGALVCMIFAAPILVGINLYIERNFGP